LELGKEFLCQIEGINKRKINYKAKNNVNVPKTAEHRKAQTFPVVAKALCTVSASL